MRLAISNIAWDVGEDEQIVKLLRRFGVDAIDVAPGKYFPEPGQAAEHEISTVKRWWADRGIEIVGMQSLLFGTRGLNVFGDESSQTAMLEHLRAVCRIGRVLGARKLVFGSPKNRDRTGVNEAKVIDRAATFFRQLGGIAAAEGVVVCLEPNPPRYGANFMTTSEETARVVRAVAHPAIRLQLDTGAMTINGEVPSLVLSEYGDLIGHIHASEPDLVPLGDGATDHGRVYAALSHGFSHAVVSIEMVATPNESHLVSIARALAVADRAYRPTTEIDLQ